MALLRQTGTLVHKNLTIVLFRHSFATVVRALVLPIALMTFLGFAKNLFIPPAVFGIADPRPVRSLPDALATAGVGTGRNTVAFVDNGLKGGAIEHVIGVLSAQVTGAGKNATRLENSNDLGFVCKSSLNGVTPCYGAVVFWASPTEGQGGLWNYTIRVDGALNSASIKTNRADNDAQVYILPLQRAVDAAIADFGARPLPAQTVEYAFTTLTQEERAVLIRVRYEASVFNFFGVTFLLGVVGIVYHMTGFMATERESGMSQLVEAMMPVRRRWQGQAARLLSYHVAFSLIYLPGWVIGSLIVKAAVFAETNAGIVLIYHILVGWALASMSLLGGSFFRRSQLSGVTVTIAIILLAILAQTITAPKTAAVAILSLLFTPCNYVYFISYMARYEQEERPTDLLHRAPGSPWNLPGLALWIFLILQIVGYPLLAAWFERYFHGSSTKGRTLLVGLRSEAAGALDANVAVRLDGFTKVYRAGFIRRLFSFVAAPKEPVVAVGGLSLSAERGQILALLGANGSGKSTTLDAIAGTNRLSGGTINVDGTGGLGIAPQKNVLWDELTVEEHVRVFNRLKSPGSRATEEEIRELVRCIDLEQKRRAYARTLSGGQKRKLQLGMMLTGGSAVCCVDEVSSGLDPLSRRKIWDILLAERGRRTIIMTTHFLDEADLLADHIAILSRGTLRAEGSSVELKNRLGAGYRIHVHNNTSQDPLRRDKAPLKTPDVPGVEKQVAFDATSYLAPSSALAAQVIRTLEAEGIHDYKFSGPTIEDVFLQLAEEARGSSNEEGAQPVMRQQTAGAKDAVTATTVIPAEKTQSPSDEHVVSTPDDDGGVHPTGKDGLELLSGRRIGYWRQAVVLFRKRVTVLKTNWFPYAAAFLIPVAAAGLVTLFVKGQKQVGCTPTDQNSVEDLSSAALDDIEYYLVGGPKSSFDLARIGPLFLPILAGQLSLFGGGGSNSSATNATAATLAAGLLQNLTLVDTLSEFESFVTTYRKNVTPAGWWLGDGSASNPPVLAYRGNEGLLNGLFGQNFLDVLLTNTTIAASYAPFDIPWSPDTGNSLQLLVYFGLAMAAYPGFFALYPNVEKRRQVRALEYSNGVRALPLWMAYLAFDFIVVLLSSAVVTALFAGLSGVWYHVGYLFVIFTLYGLASILLAYVISLFCKTQLSAYAFVAAGQAVLFLVYFIAYLSTFTYAPITKVEQSLLTVHFVVSAFAPIGSVIRTLFIALNLFSTACKGFALNPNPGDILVYGGPIFYLCWQSVLLFLLLLWFDSGALGSWAARVFTRRRRPSPAGDLDPAQSSDAEVAHELARVSTAASNPAGAPRSSTAADDAVSGEDGLRVLHLTKSFGRTTAVDNVSFGIRRGEVFALLGPNGAGKSTTISLIRGDISPSASSSSAPSDILVEDVSVIRHRAAARAHLGVCPQFDAVDAMTVEDHLVFYARVRGIPDVAHNVDAVLAAVGLAAFRTRMAAGLSGGNKRKLSLAIALMGNPTVVLLDEPSSGLDAAAKRIMWRTLAAVVPGRSILLTTHSMEEADALAGRAGILATRMLALGTTDALRRRFGDALHVHLVARGAPRTSEADMARMADWVRATWPDARLERETWHGQMRFAVPVAAVSAGGEKNGKEGGGGEEIQAEAGAAAGAASGSSALGRLVVLLEENKEALRVEHYSVSPTTLDQVFLAIVGKHNVQEENYGAAAGRAGTARWWRRR